MTGIGYLPPVRRPKYFLMILCNRLQKIVSCITITINCTAILITCDMKKNYIYLPMVWHLCHPHRLSALWYWLSSLEVWPLPLRLLCKRVTHISFAPVPYNTSRQMNLLHFATSIFSPDPASFCNRVKL